MGFRDDLIARWSADRLPRRTWLLLALFGLVVVVLDVAYLTGAMRVVLAACFAVYTIACAIQAARTRRRP